MAGDYKQAAVAIDAQDEVGESPTWDASRDRLLWVDHSSGRVHEAKMSESGHWAETKVWELRRYLAAVIPRKSGGFVALGATSIDLVEEAGVCQPVARLESEQAGEKLNDAKCDSRGRIWTGSLTVDFLLGAAALYRVDVDGTVVKMLDGLTLGLGGLRGGHRLDGSILRPSGGKRRGEHRSAEQGRDRDRAHERRRGGNRESQIWHGGIPFGC